MLKLKILNIFFLLCLTLSSVSAQELKIQNFSVSTTSENTFPEFCVAGGMGVNLMNMPDLADYLNSLAQTNTYDDFSNSFEFFGSAGYRWNKNWGMKIEFGYLFKSFDVYLSAHEVYENRYYIQTPVVILQRILVDENYFFKLGAGLGYYSALLNRKIINDREMEYKSGGIGIKIDVEGNTPLGDNLFGYIAADLRIGLLSDMKTEEKPLTYTRNRSDKNVNLSFFSIGLKFGLLYLI